LGLRGLPTRFVFMNIFKTLKRGNSREEEYFSAALAILLDKIPELTTYLLDEILGISDDLEEYEIIPEYPVLDGRVDIAIKSIHFEIFIENKISSGLYESQLERYSKHLESIDKETKLILLTRDFIDDETIPKYTDKYIFWTELYTLIEQFTNSISACVEFEIDSKKYLLKQFLNFLREENMSDEKVSWEYIEGIKSFMNLLNMIQSSLDQLKREKTINNYGNKSIGKDYAGFYINKCNQNSYEFWVGIFYADAHELLVQIENCFDETDKNIPEEDYTYDFNKTYFLAFSKEEQKEAIHNFIENSLDELNNL